MDLYFKKIFDNFELVLIFFVLLTVIIQVMQVYVFEVPWIGSLFNAILVSLLTIFNAAACGKLKP
jgi:hypothetical protein